MYMPINIFVSLTKLIQLVDGFFINVDYFVSLKMTESYPAANCFIFP